ncbi:MAG: hypothetical protein COA78_26120 [Blastopirellula sp.]|nr:MAG: hypothetical protein COA78_26120 [Blastopirellula sp.]
MNVRLGSFLLAKYFLLGILFIGVIVPCLQAETGEVLHLPLKRQPGAKKLPPSGLKLQVDTRWVDATGYRPVKITIETKNNKPTAGDRILYVQIQPEDWSSNKITVGKYIELPQGSASVSSTLLIPQSNTWYSYEVTTYEDGREIKELSIPEFDIPSQIHNNWADTYPAILYLDSDLPSRDSRLVWANRVRKKMKEEGLESPLVDLRVLCTATNENDSNNVIELMRNSTNPIDLLDRTALLGHFDMLNPSDLPELWLALTSIDLIFISKSDLEKTSVEKKEVLFKWLNAGGNLCVTEMGKSQGEYGKLVELLNLNIKKSKSNAGWILPRKYIEPEEDSESDEENLNVFQEAYSEQGYNGDYQKQTLMIDDQGKVVINFNPKKPRNKKIASGDFDYQMRKCDFGLLVGFTGSPFPGELAQWDQLFRNIDSSRWQWSQRHGMAQDYRIDDFWHFMIPGIGMAPIRSFQIFITLFVILIGPVNYFFLKRVGRLNWLIVTVPAGAFIVTSLLMIYALFSDGFSTRTRERTLTLLDQQTGTSTTWSHQTHYAGLAPSSGFQFPADAAVYEFRTYHSLDRNSSKELEWNEHQNRTKGFFQSRMTHQNLAIRPAMTDLHLKFTMNHDAALSVENNLGCKVLLAVAYDHESNPFVIRDLEIDEKVRSLSLMKDEDKNELKQLFTESELALLEGVDADYFDQRRSRAIVYESRLEVEMERVKSEFFKQKKPHTYLAIVESFPEAPHGVKTSTPEKSVQVIRGSW